MIKPILRLIPSYRRLEQDNARLRTETAEWRRFYPPGHFYSPIPSIRDIEDGLSRRSSPPFPGIDLRIEQQLTLLEQIISLYPQHPFQSDKTRGRRYYYSNDSYGIVDALFLYGMLRVLRPRRVIEVGSGFSSAAMLDVDEAFSHSGVEFSFVDPDMSRLRGLLSPEDTRRIKLLEQRVQDVPLTLFDKLTAGDLLFIDSSHVSKVGSDVNHIIFEVFPRLSRGVFIHIHDISATFEYPRDWLIAGRSWNEQYILRAFLMFNSAFSIELMPPLLLETHHDVIAQRMPLCASGGGGQIWLRRTAQ